MGATRLRSKSIRIYGARQNNLKNVDVEIPGDRLTVITGVSGSGKSSLAFDTLYAEGQRRFVESMSAYARQFLERISRPAVREIRGISPAIAIRQKSGGRNPRSTVGTVTEIYDFLRLLYARAGTLYCYRCGRPVTRDSIQSIVEQLLGLPEGSRLYIGFPYRDSVLDLNGESNGNRIALASLLENLTRHGFHRLVTDLPDSAAIRQLPQEAPETSTELQNSFILVDRLVIRGGLADRLSDSLETCYSEGNGVAEVIVFRAGEADKVWKTLRFTERFECQDCQIQYRTPEPRLFSFNNPFGACPNCQGFGNTFTLDRDLIIPDPSKCIGEGPIDPFNKPRYRRFQQKLEEFAADQGIARDIPFEDLSESVQERIWNGEKGFPGVKGLFRYLNRKKYKTHVRVFISRYRGYTRCADCRGERLCREARSVRLQEKRISELTALPAGLLYRFFENLELPGETGKIATKLMVEINKRLEFLIKVGLDYLALDRLTSTLSGGEMQRIQLSAALGSSLVGTLYVLDEPSIGLHPRDQRRLISILEELKKLGNTIVVVEHEPEIIAAADRIVDVGPGAGELGGQIIHNGNFASLLKNKESLTGRYLSGDLRIATPVFRRSKVEHFLTIRGARQHNLKNITITIPLGVMVCVTGVSGSGKSTLVHDVLYAGIKKRKGEWREATGAFDALEGWQRIGEVVMVDQAPIGKTSRSNPITYMGAFDEVRKTFASLREAHARNLKPAHFSFNVSGGRCETCQGAGTVTVPMQFLADVELECEDCRGTRFQKRVLEVTYKGRNIHEVLQLTVREAIEFFAALGPLVRKLKFLDAVGLGYLRLGQPATTLSGGEAQRIKLASHLSRRSRQGLFIFDEPTTGLHFDDISKLLKAFDRLISQGASVLVIEHNLEVIKSADWIIDLGPEGGEQGGWVVAQGAPEEIAACEASHTGRFLKKVIAHRAAG